MVRISEEKLVKALMENSRMKFTRLAKLFGVTETAIRKRMKALEKKGIIRKYTLEVDPKKLGYEIDALIGIDTEPEMYMSIMNMLKRDNKVIKLYSSSGDHMIMIRVWLKNYKSLMDFVEKLNRTKGITRVCPATIIEELK